MNKSYHPVILTVTAVMIAAAALLIGGEARAATNQLNSTQLHNQSSDSNARYIVTSTLADGEDIHSALLKYKVIDSGWVNRGITLNGASVSGTCSYLTPGTYTELFTFATTTISDRSGVRDFVMLKLVDACGSGFVLASTSLQYYGVSTTATDPAFWNVYTGNRDADAANFKIFILWNSPELGDSEVLITSDVQGEFVPTGNRVLSGTCGTFGTGRLYTRRGYFQSTTTDEFLRISTGFDCNEDGTWEAERVIAPGWQIQCIVDTDYLIAQSATSTHCIGIYGTGATSTALISPLYPTPQEAGYFALQPSENWPFRFSYSLQAGFDELQSSVEICSYPNSLFSTCTSLASSSVQGWDPDYNGYFDSSVFSATTTEFRYFGVHLYASNTLLYQYNFATFGVDDPRYPAAISPSSSCGFWCDVGKAIFVPRGRTLHLFTDGLPSMLETRFPFGYFAQAKDKLLGLTITASTTPDFSLQVPFNYGTATSATYTIPITAFNEPRVQGIFDMLRPWFVAVLWLGLLAAIWHEFTDVKL